MDERETIGNLREIDTDFEREKIEYRPHVHYQPEKEYDVTLPQERTIGESPSLDEDFEEDYGFEERNPLSIYRDFVSLHGTIRSIRSELESVLQGTRIPLSASDMEKLMDNFPDSRDLVSQEGIDFEFYKDSFEDSENPKNILLQDMVYSYAEDVDGSIELELYEDIREMEETLLEVYHLFKESILKDFRLSQVPSTPEENEDLMNELKESLIEQEKIHEAAKDLYETEESTYYDYLREDYGSSEYFEQLKKYEDAKRPFDLSTRNRNIMDEFAELIDQSLFGHEDFVGKIQTKLVTGSDIDGEEVMKVLEKQKSNRQELGHLFKLSQLALKLQVNKQIEEKRQYRDVLKNINNLSRKERAHDELLTAYGLKKQMYLNLYDSLRYLESPTKDYTVETFFNQLAGGLDVVSEEYDAFLSDTYRMYLSENEIRGEKLDKVFEKNEAREGYHLVLSQQ